MSSAPVQPLSARKSKALKGTIQVPGDKSMSHRALMFGLVSLGETQIEGLLEGDDVLCTARAVEALGAQVIHHGPGKWSVHGVGLGALKEPQSALDMGNSGTAARLLMGLLASHDLTATFIGDESLSSRPMGRVTNPLEQMGASFQSREGGRLPLTMKGAQHPLPIRYELPVASAQVKSAVLLAGLNTPGETTVIEPWPTRDHSERMMRAFGAELHIEDAKGGKGRVITVVGQRELYATDVQVAGDPSSAAFLVVAALITPGSEICVQNIGMNPTRTGLFEVLKAMGGDIEFVNEREVAGEPVADIIARSSQLKGIEVSADIAPRMIDEYPILAIAAANAEGTTLMQGVEELRVKETDRIGATARGLEANGVVVHETADSLSVEGCGQGGVPGGGSVTSHFDHRIAMSFAVLGGAAQKPVRIDDGRAIATSFPNFLDLMRGLGADLS
ncbi:MAG: 3-phosphoshikimate 1-carboxyvinyltransferase [Sphingomonadales bacterium]|jgi:3-phosphoshikimate 1-carboxyvinyltransferase